ncbi:hypothetical protein JW905_16770, partial [bacterium]|nr:hypothetical protein [candidate division CSSED10-310 bacterium]
MKTCAGIAAILTTAAALWLIAGKLTSGSPFGPASITALAGLGILLLVLTVIMFVTRRHGPVIARRLSMAVAVFVLLYLAADLAGGWVFIERFSPPNVPDHHTHHRLLPGTRSRFTNPEWDYVQRVNSLGLRGQDVSLEKTPGTWRLLMLGDSFTMGKGVDDDKTFSALLEQMLNQQYAGQPGCQVLNAGVDSYSPILSYFQLTGHLKNLQP